MSSPTDHAGTGHGEPTDDRALVVSLEALLATARLQLGELRGTLTRAIAFATAQEHPQ